MEEEEEGKEGLEEEEEESAPLARSSLRRWQEGIHKHIWRLFASGEYTAKSAYDILFEGAISFFPI